MVSGQLGFESRSCFCQWNFFFGGDGDCFFFNVILTHREHLLKWTTLYCSFQIFCTCIWGYSSFFKILRAFPTETWLWRSYTRVAWPVAYHIPLACGPVPSVPKGSHTSVALKSVGCYFFLSLFFKPKTPVAQGATPKEQESTRSLDYFLNAHLLGWSKWWQLIYG